MDPEAAVVDVLDTGYDRALTAGNPNVPWSKADQPPRGRATFSDGSGPIFNMYAKMSQEEDEKMAHRWQRDADGILIFTGLFSVAVAVLLTVSIQDLRPSSQDTSAFYLANIYQLLADPNISRVSILATSAIPPPFSPPRFAILVNVLWSLSLVMSLTCGLLATLLQQWARRFLTVTQPPHWSPHERARIRSFFANGVEKFQLPSAVETLPTLLHVSLFLFFSGLLIFLVNIDHTTFIVVILWVGGSGVTYGSITLLPIFSHDSPYYTPLSFSAWFLLNAVRQTIFGILTFVTPSTSRTWSRFEKMRITSRKRILWGMVKTARETASKMSAKIDWDVLKWTFDALDEDRELEQFFDGIPAFCTSQVVYEPKGMLGAELDDRVLTEVCNGFLIRTFLSRSLSERIKEKRFIVCMQAIDALDSPFPSSDFLSQVFGPPAMDGVLKSIQMGHLLRSRCDSIKGVPAVYAQTLVGGIIANVPERDGRWKTLVMAQLGISEDVFQDYLAHGDSVLLANWIHIARQLIRLDREHYWIPEVLENILSIPSKFEIRDTLPTLQHDFCALWNEFAREAHESGSYITNSFLRSNRHHYIALHQGTDDVPPPFDTSTKDHGPSYPVCNIPDHHSDGATDKATRLLIHPDVPSFPAFTPGHSRIHLTEQSSPRGVAHTTTTIQYKTDFDIDAPIPDIPSSSSPVPASSDTLPADPLMSSARSPTSQIELITPGSRLLGSVPEISFSLPHVTSDSRSNLPETEATFDTHDNPPATDLAQPEQLIDIMPPRDADNPA